MRTMSLVENSRGIVLKGKDHGAASNGGDQEERDNPQQGAAHTEPSSRKFPL